LAIRKIVTYPAKILETPCEKVIEFNRDIVQLLNDMYETMIHADGVGLAAPQIGLKKQVAVVDIGDQHGKIELINPIIIKKRGEQIDIEGCLSFPGLYGDVKRAEYIKVRAQNRHGKPFILEASGFLARAIQHEVDHLKGVLFTSKVIKYYKQEELEEVEG